MINIFIDIETYSDEDLKTAGVYKYAESEEFKILLFAFSIDQQKTKCIDLESAPVLPPELVEAILNDDIRKHAYNANFERVCLSMYLQQFGLLPKGQFLNPSSWFCTMVQCSRLGLPRSLKEVGAALDIKNKKLDTGTALISLFCKPNKKTKQRTKAHQHPQNWALFIDYCIEDVSAEMDVYNRVKFLEVSTSERNLEIQDQRINDRGAYVDRFFINSCISIDLQEKSKILSTLKKLTGLDNPNSRNQFINYLKGEGINTPALTKDDVSTILCKDISKAARKCLELKQRLGKVSTSKYIALSRMRCKDGRVRGLLRFYGAQRTGRWAGSNVQIHNLPRTYVENIDVLKNVVKTGDVDIIKLFYPNIERLLSELIRPSIIARPGYELIVSDFSAIEARVLAWVAGEEWRLEVFRSHGKIYEASIAKVLNIGVNDVTKAQRSIGKLIELACGYGGAAGAMKAFHADDFLSDSEIEKNVKLWRDENQRIVQFWHDIGRAAVDAVKYGRPSKVRSITVMVDRGALFIGLPSGRSLVYPKVHIWLNKFGRECIKFYGKSSAPGHRGDWVILDTYGAKITENIVQALARDILGRALSNAEPNFNIIFHVHDEIITEQKKNTKTLDQLNRILSAPVPYLPGLPLKGAGYISEYYKKD